MGASGAKGRNIPQISVALTVNQRGVLGIEPLETISGSQM